MVEVLVSKTGRNDMSALRQQVYGVLSAGLCAGAVLSLAAAAGGCAAPRAEEAAPKAAEVRDGAKETADEAAFDDLLEKGA